MFDLQSCPHSQAFNEADEPRVVLLINFFHPDLPASEWKPLHV
jgi:aspartyl/asparaginyl beta-hydroxylase (cupin superfamily)